LAEIYFRQKFIFGWHSSNVLVYQIRLMSFRL